MGVYKAGDREHVPRIDDLGFADRKPRTDRGDRMTFDEDVADRRIVEIVPEVENAAAANEESRHAAYQRVIFTIYES